MGIYSNPVQYPGQPENAMRAAAGERPLCFDRPDFPERVLVMGKPVAFRVANGQFVVAPSAKFVENPMSKDCRSWAVRAPDPNNPADTGEDPAVESIPARECWRCWGCRHLPTDPRVVIRAAASELW